LAAELYPLTCIEAAAEAFKDHLVVAVRSTDSVAAVIELTVTAQTESESLVRRSFLNYMLDLAIQQRFA
jgi:hypothetical protein